MKIGMKRRFDLIVIAVMGLVIAIESLVLMTPKTPSTDLYIIEDIDSYRVIDRKMTATHSIQGDAVVYRIAKTTEQLEAGRQDRECGLMVQRLLLYELGGTKASGLMSRLGTVMGRGPQ